MKEHLEVKDLPDRLKETYLTGLRLKKENPGTSMVKLLRKEGLSMSTYHEANILLGHHKANPSARIMKRKKMLLAALGDTTLTIKLKKKKPGPKPKFTEIVHEEKQDSKFMIIISKDINIIKEFMGEL